MTMTRGLIFGKFAPLTNGHIEFIRQAASQVGALYLFLSYDQKFVDAQPEWVRPKLGLADRYVFLHRMVIVGRAYLEGKSGLLCVFSRNVWGNVLGSDLLRWLWNV